MDGRATLAERVDAAPDGFALDPDGLPVELQRRPRWRCRRDAGRPARAREEVMRLLATLGAGGTATLAGVKCLAAHRRFTPALPRR